MKFLVAFVAIVAGVTAEVAYKANPKHYYATSRQANVGSYPDSPIVVGATYPAPQKSFFGLSSDFELGFPGNGLITTGIVVAVALVGLTILIQVGTKMFDIVKNTIGKEGRSLEAEDLHQMMNFALEAIEKFQSLYE